MRNLPVFLEQSLPGQETTSSWKAITVYRAGHNVLPYDVCWTTLASTSCSHDLIGANLEYQPGSSKKIASIRSSSSLICEICWLADSSSSPVIQVHNSVTCHLSVPTNASRSCSKVGMLLLPCRKAQIRGLKYMIRAQVAR